MRKIFLMLVVLAVSILFTGCIRPYDKPSYVEVDTFETAFVIPLFENENISEVQYPTDPHAFNIAYEAFIKGAKYADKGNTFWQINNYSGKQEKEHGI